MRVDLERALDRGLAALIRAQKADHWEGEVVWCPMLAAQYALMCHITGTPISAERKRRLRLNFERSQLQGSGLWGLHDHSEPYLFATTLVYVAARTLGVGADDPLLQPARAFFRREGGVGAIPSWGKFWLSMLNLYEWEGLNPVPPEAWILPRVVPLHPSNFYCHTRLIYMAMAVIYGRKFQAPRTAWVDGLRAELYPGQTYREIRFRALRSALREQDTYAPPSRALRAIYRAAQAAERVHIPALRRRTMNSLLDQIRWELRTTDHTCISPVSGILNLLALWLWDHRDPDFVRGIEQFEGWIWEDDEDGVRVAGARSSSWDTAFVLQALSRVPISQQSDTVRDVATRGAHFLEREQITTTFEGYRDAFRVDPLGGYCFAGKWHGWPVSDCTAEAITGLVRTADRGHPGYQGPAREVMERGVRFILQCQNRDGGFGTYEAEKSRIGLEWMNPAEMFSDSMTDLSHIECTASCIVALSAIRARVPELSSSALDRRIERAARWLLEQQRSDGSWPGAWGIHFTYGTMFGIRGLRAAGHSANDPAIRRAARFLLERQRKDGGWGEHPSTPLTGVYTPHSESQVVQTSWALMGLLYADEPDAPALYRAASFLARAQNETGEWPKQDMAGVFFHTALLDYVLYRSYFPVWALAEYQSRRQRIDPPRPRQGASISHDDDAHLATLSFREVQNPAV